MRFVDTFEFRDNDFDPAEHPKSKENGRFVKKGASTEGTSKKIENAAKVVRAVKIHGKEFGLDEKGFVVTGEDRFVGKVFSEVEEKVKEEHKKRAEEWKNSTDKVTTENSLDEIFDSPFNKDSAKHAVRTAVEKLRGDYPITTKNGEKITVRIDNVTKDEAPKRIGGKYVKDDRATEVAKAYIHCLMHWQEIVSKGRETEWVHNPEHNSEFEFKTFYKRLEYNGKNPVFCVDIRRPYTRRTETPKLYSNTNEATNKRGLEIKAETLGLDLKGLDGEMSVLAVSFKCLGLE